MNKREIAGFIDHTLLKPDTTEEQIIKLCHEAKEHRFKAVCILPTYVNLASKLLIGTGVNIATVIGFPLGANLSDVKVLEAKEALANGASELDMVINIGALKDKKYELVKEEIASIVKIAHEACPKALVKVIIETSILSNEEKQVSCGLAVEAGADFVKTSTGFSGGGATVDDVLLMNECVKKKAKVKASGGIRTYQDALKMIEAGASRIGTSAGVSIVMGLENDTQGY